MEPPGWLAYALGQVLQERDHVVASALLYLLDPLHIEARLLPYLLDRACGHHADLGHGLRGQDLYLHPALHAGVIAPYLFHLRAAVAFDHRGGPSASVLRSALR